MQFSIKINGVDFAPYIRADGVRFEETTRTSRAVTVLNGTSYRAEITKLRATVDLVEMRDSAWDNLRAALQQRPATVEFTKPDGTTAAKQFYVIGLREPVRNVKGGNTYFRNVSFNLEEK